VYPVVFNDPSRKLISYSKRSNFITLEGEIQARSDKNLENVVVFVII